MKSILLAVDGSEESKKAAKEVAKLANLIDADVTIITVLEDNKIKLREIEAYIPDKDIGEIDQINKKELEKKGTEILSKAEKYFKERKIKVNKTIQYGDPADLICSYAEDNNFDLIAVADKGLGGIKRFFIGSISEKVIRHAKQSVLIVK